MSCWVFLISFNSEHTVIFGILRTIKVDIDIILTPNKLLVLWISKKKDSKDCGQKNLALNNIVYLIVNGSSWRISYRLFCKNMWIVITNRWSGNKCDSTKQSSNVNEKFEEKIFRFFCSGLSSAHTFFS